MKKIISSILAFIVMTAVLCSCDKTKDDKQLAKEHAAQNIAMNAGKVIEGDKISSNKINVKVDGKKKDDKILFQNDDIKVTLDSVSLVAETPCIIVEIENNGDKNMGVGIYNVCVDHCQTLISSYSDVVESKQSSKLGINIFDDADGKSGYVNTTYVRNAKIDNIEFEIGTYTSDDQNGRTDNTDERKNAVLDIGGEDLKIDAPKFAKKVYENDNVAVWYCGKNIQSENKVYLKMFIENKADKKLSFEVNDTSYDKDNTTCFMSYIPFKISAKAASFCNIMIIQTSTEPTLTNDLDSVNIDMELSSDDLKIKEHTQLKFEL